MRQAWNARLASAISIILSFSRRQTQNPSGASAPHSVCRPLLKTSWGQASGAAAQALRAVTIDAAYAIRMEDKIGSIAPGKTADFTVLGQDPYEVPATQLKDIPIWGTVFEGKPFPVKK